MTSLEASPQIAAISDGHDRYQVRGANFSAPRLRR